MNISRIILFFVLMLFASYEMQAQRVGLVLSGGGVRGFAHIGVIKALEENNIPIDYLAGTSAGALVGSMYVTGKSPQEMEQLVLNDRFRQLATGVIEEDLGFYFSKKEIDASWVTIKLAYDSLLKTKLPGSIINSAPVDFELLTDLSIPSAKANYCFDSLFVPYRCVSADIVNKKQVIFKNGDLAQAVRASMAFPLYFSPLTIDNKILFDGGIYNNFPVDVMTTDFAPDIMIGVNAGGTTEIPVEDNVLSQMKNIIVAVREYKMPSEKDIMISPNIDNFGVFEFDEAKAAIDSGYAATMRKMDVIKAAISRKVSAEEMKAKREKFLAGNKNIFIDKIIVNGVTTSQAEYIHKILNSGNECISLDNLRTSFFKLIADDNVRYAFPRLQYNAVTGYYDLTLYVRQEKDLRVDFGGNFSSRPINEAYIGVQYNIWGKQSLRFMANSYFGKLYSSLQVKLRLDFPSRFRVFVEPEFTINQFDYFKSNSTFFEDVKPSYLVLYDAYSGLNLGIPVRNKGKLITNAGYANLKNSYYQTRGFLQADTTDRTNYDAFTTGFSFERNTLDRKQYASTGTYFSVQGKLVTGFEKTIPGSTSLVRDTISKSLRWLQLRLVYDNYFKKTGPVSWGYYADLLFSGQPFFANYTATILSANQFNAVPEASTLFLPNFRAHNYVGAGLKNIWRIRGNLETRVEGYIFQPLQEIVENPETGKAQYTNALSKRYFMATGGVVFHSPLGPICVSVNYFDKRDPAFSFMFHFGYILFNKRAL